MNIDRHNILMVLSMTLVGDNTGLSILDKTIELFIKAYTRSLTM